MRTIESVKNRIHTLTQKGETQNHNLIQKQKRILRKLEAQEAAKK